MPIGYLVTTALIAWCTLLALAPLRRPWAVGFMSFLFASLLNEVPFVAFYYLLASTFFAVLQSGIDSPIGWTGLGLAVLATLGLVPVARRGLRARRAIEAALSEGLGAAWRTELDAGLAAGLRRRAPVARILFGPFFVRRRDVERMRNISYGDAGRRNRLDVYRRRTPLSGGPVMVHLHGGFLVRGRKDREARPLLYRLASQGWVCISANYRLRPGAHFPDHLIDVKKVIAWVREYGSEHGADPQVLFLAGTSSGGQLAALAAFTSNDPTYQPGFETADTAISAVIYLSGYYGDPHAHERLPFSPMAYDGTGAPPFFVAHGDQDTVVPVDAARMFVQRLRRTSSQPVVYAELPGAQHSFDRFHSLRFEAVVDAIEAFTAWVRSRQTTPDP